MKRVALLLIALSVSTGLVMLSCQESTDAAQGKRAAAKSKKSLFASPPSGSITVLSFPTAQEIYILPAANVFNPQSDPSQFTNKEYFAGKTPLQVTRPAMHYYVVVKQTPGAEYRADGEDNHVYVFPDEKQVFTDAKIYNINHADDSRSFVSSWIWPKSMTPADFMRALPSELLFTVPDQEAAQIKAYFQTKGVPEQEIDSMITMLRTTGKAGWHGADYSKNAFAYYSALGPKGELKELTFLPKE